MLYKIVELESDDLGFPTDIILRAGVSVGDTSSVLREVNADDVSSEQYLHMDAATHRPAVITCPFCANSVKVIMFAPPRQ